MRHKKFQVGDRVMTRAGSPYSCMTGTVTDIGAGEAGWYIEVALDHVGRGFLYSKEELDLVEVSPTTEAPTVVLPNPQPTEAQKRKAQPVATGVLAYFPDALLYVAQVSKVGNDQHNPGQPLHWDRNKSTDEADCIARHLINDVSGDEMDTDGILHAGKVAWRALAHLQKKLEKRKQGGKP